MSYFFCIVREYGPIFLFKVTGNIWDVNSIFVGTTNPPNDLLCHFLLCLFHFFLHVLCRTLGHWSVHLFYCYICHIQWHIYHAYWSGLTRGWWMGKVLKQLWKGTWTPWWMWRIVATYIFWTTSSTIYLVTWFGQVGAPPSALNRV